MSVANQAKDEGAIKSMNKIIYSRNSLDSKYSKNIFYGIFLAWTRAAAVRIFATMTRTFCDQN